MMSLSALYTECFYTLSPNNILASHRFLLRVPVLDEAMCQGYQHFLARAIKGALCANCSRATWRIIGRVPQHACSLYTGR